MAGFHTKTFLKHDSYMTPKYAWENINQYIPKDKIIWEAFMGDGASGKYLKELGCKEVIHDYDDFFESDKGEILISNPPFSKCKDILPRLKELDKPFILIMPSSKICTSYMRIFKDNENPIQIIIPRKRIHFNKLVDGKIPDNWKNSCNFDCFYYVWKLNLPRDIIWLDNE